MKKSKSVLAALLLLASVAGNQASAISIQDADPNGPKALDGAWKMLKTSCLGNEVKPFENIFKSLTLTLHGLTGMAETSLVGIEQAHVELSVVEYLPENQVRLECSEPSKTSYTDFCNYMARTVSYHRDGGVMTFSYENRTECANGQLVEEYELKK